VGEKFKKQNAYKFDEATIARLREVFASLSLDEKDDELFDSNECEVAYALQLIRTGLIEPNIFSSPDWLKEIEERFKLIDGTPSILSELIETLPLLGYEFTPFVDQPESNSPAPPSMVEAMGNLQKQWITLDRYSDENFDWRACENDIPNYRNLTTVHAFVRSVIAGEYPTPEIILSLAKSFDLYLTAAGELSVEEVFFGRPKKRAGNFAGRSIRDLRFLFFHDTVRREKVMVEGSGKKFSLYDEANHFLTYERMDDDGNVGHYDVDTFLRGYRRWRKAFEEMEREESKE
jgi:hypothetical protein